jgi:hypothetical protein
VGPHAFLIWGFKAVQSASIRRTMRSKIFSLFVRWCCQGRVTPIAEQWFKFRRPEAIASCVINFGIVKVLRARQRNISSTDVSNVIILLDGSSLVVQIR